MANIDAVGFTDNAPKRNSSSEAVQMVAAWVKLDANPTAADVIRFVKLPPHSYLLDATFYASVLDSDGTDEMDVDFGWTADAAPTLVDGTDISATATDADGISGDLGAVLTDTARITAGQAAGSIFANGLYFSEGCTITGTVNVDAETFAAGTIRCLVTYVVLPLGQRPA